MTDEESKSSLIKALQTVFSIRPENAIKKKFLAAQTLHKKNFMAAQTLHDKLRLQYIEVRHNNAVFIVLAAGTTSWP